MVHIFTFCFVVVVFFLDIKPLSSRSSSQRIRDIRIASNGGKRFLNFRLS